MGVPTILGVLLCDHSEAVALDFITAYHVDKQVYIL